MDARRVYILPRQSICHSSLHESRRSANIPLTLVHIEDEDHMCRIWERSMVLVRPNGHVA
jgi:hypothetical protein